MEFLLRTLAAGIVLTEYFPAVDDGVVTDGEYEVPRRSVTGPSAFGESQEGSPKSTLERPSGGEDRARATLPLFRYVFRLWLGRERQHVY